MGYELSIVSEKIFGWIKKAFMWLFSDWKNITMAVLLVMAVVFYFNYRSINNKYDNVIHEHSDTVTVYQNKIGELYAQNTAYITDIKNLKESNRELYDEVKNLKDNPIVVTKYETVTEYKDIVVRDTVYRDKNGVFSFDIDYSDDWTSIEGSSSIDTESMFGEVRFDCISFVNNFTLDLIESKKGDLSFIVKSDNPYCQINTITGVMLSPEDSKAIRKRFDKPWCIAIGIGPSFTIVDNKFAVLPALHVTVGRKIFSF